MTEREADMSSSAVGKKKKGFAANIKSKIRGFFGSRSAFKPAGEIRRSKRQRKPLPPHARTALKWAVYVLAGFAFYAAATSGAAGSSKGLMLLPLGCAIAMFSGEISASVTGFVAGILLDMASGQLIGFSSFYLCIVLGLACAMFRQFFRKNLINFEILTLAVCLAYYYLVYFFYYRIWDYEGYGLVLTTRLVPSFIKTMVGSPFIFGGVWLTEKLSRGTRQLEIEEQDDKIDRV